MGKNELDAAFEGFKHLAFFKHRSSIKKEGQYDRRDHETDRKGGCHRGIRCCPEKGKGDHDQENDDHADKYNDKLGQEYLEVVPDTPFKHCPDIPSIVPDHREHSRSKKQEYQPGNNQKPATEKHTPEIVDH